ncbi:MAG: MFS transporter [Actinomycetota bacterium]|nr:MFS transporter [Actinomycetota bacterium]
MFASSVPSPLYIVYQHEWHFSAITLTGVFAVYAIALLVALLVVGSISDHVGRRPTLLVALAVEILAMLAFAEASGVGWLFAARILQGLATGAAMGAITAALLDLQPASKPWLGGLMGAVAPMTGLALGALSAGLLVDYGPDPVRFVFWLLIAVFILAVGAGISIPETVSYDGRGRDSLVPRLAVPRQIRSAFLAAVPSLTATWALGGLILSLGASLTAGVLDQTSHVAGGLPIFVMAGISALMAVRLRHTHPQVTARWGLSALIVGVTLALAALQLQSDALFLVASAIAGLGFGPAFAGVFRGLSELAPLDQRAALVSSVLAVSYLAFSLPAVAAGAAITDLGLRDTAEIYGAGLVVSAAIALALSGRLANSVPETEPHQPDPLAPAPAGHVDGA